MKNTVFLTCLPHLVEIFLNKKEKKKSEGALFVKMTCKKHMYNIEGKQKEMSKCYGNIID
jgi:hypothetical protein